MVGIYLIENTLNNKKYIGSSNNIDGRIYRHKRMLINNSHFNKHLQSSWNKHGEKNFVFSVLERGISEDELLNRESFWFDYYDIFEDEKGYNILSIAKRHKGRRLKLTDEHRKNISKGLNGFYENNSSSKKGKKYPDINVELSQETRNKISNSLKKYYQENDNPSKGRKHTKESKDKMSDSLKKYFQENESFWKGKTHTEESKTKMSNSHKGFKQSKDQKEKLSKRISGKGHPLYGKKGKDNPKYIFLDEAKIDIVVDLYRNKNYSISKIIIETGLKRPVIRRELEKKGIEILKKNQFTSHS